MKAIGIVGQFFLTLGRSLMLPIAVLPVAGILLRIGQPDILEHVLSTGMSHDTVAIITTISTLFAKAGGAVFDNLPVIFAIGIAVGFAKDGHGAVALAAYVGHTIFISALSAVNPDLNMGVLSGIIIGAVAGGLYNRYSDIQLPSYLAFFGGRRFISIATGLSALVLACVAWLVWPPIQAGINGLGNWIIDSGNFGMFIYGVANRMLIPLGLHHVLNTLVWFTFGDYSVIENGVSVVKHGDLWRFFAHDPKAGGFMAGMFPPLMFGLPGAALAMILSTSKKNRPIAAGILVSAAITAFLTGITEPIEFSFMFVAFPLYVVHAILTGISFIIMNSLDVHLGFTFSAGLFDYLLSYGLGKNGIYLLLVGPLYFILYFGLFYILIKKFNIRTPGRENTDEDSCEQEVDSVSVEKTKPVSADELGAQFIAALGGKDNIISLGNCTTRLRLDVKDNKNIDIATLKKLGAAGVLDKIDGKLQVIIGTHVESVANKIKDAMK